MIDSIMFISLFDVFSIGIGPSSSHTVGPMRAARAFVELLDERGVLESVAAVRVELYGSLAATGVGHGTPRAVLLGLEGVRPESAFPEDLDRRAATIDERGTLRLLDRVEVPFGDSDIGWHPRVIAGHPNTLSLVAVGPDGQVIGDDTFYSIGGGFIEHHSAPERADARSRPVDTAIPFPFDTAEQLLALCRDTGLSISAIVLANETCTRSEEDVIGRTLAIRDAMELCAASGMSRTGVLPGGLRVGRRAPDWARRLDEVDPGHAPAFWQERVNLVALAVNEENASGGRVVTAPTNGAAGIIPAVLHYALCYVDSTADRDTRTADFLLTASAVATLFKKQASISGAEMGCQGEVGSASSMAAAGLAQVLGGTPAQVENAAEIAMEHNLGLTCDPVGGLVQIPCIERNAIAAAKAINAAKMALWGDGAHSVSLDAVIRTMRDTGRDMSSKYKETSMGGLAVNVPEC